MQNPIPRRAIIGLGLGLAALTLAACDPDAPPPSGSAYYDSMMWNDYYYGYRPGYRPPHRPPRPPIGTVPPRPMPPIYNPPVPTPY